MKRKILSAFWVLVIICTLLTMAVSADTGNFDDIDDHWARISIDKWAGRGVIQGSNGNFRPNDSITRAEFAAVINRIMGYKNMTNTAFNDVSGNDWYYDDVAKLYAAGIMAGDGSGTMRPEENITREEAVALIARAFYVTENAGNEQPFPDAGNISGWASFLVDGMKAEGYISGDSDGNFNPKAVITRAEVVTILDNMIAVYINEPTEYDSELVNAVQGNVLINTAGVTVKNMDISGNLWITAGVGSGDVTIENVDVSGTVHICGAESGNVSIAGGNFGTIRVDEGRVNLSEDTKAGRIYLDNTAFVSKGAMTLDYDASTNSVTLQGAIDKLMLDAEGTVTAEIGGSVYNVTPPNGEISNITLGNNAVVREMTLATGATISGAGNIEKAIVNADGVHIDSGIKVKPESIFVVANTEITVANTEYIGKDDYLSAGDETDKTLAAESSSEGKLTGGGSSGGSSGGGTTEQPTSDLIFKWKSDGTPGGNQNVTSPKGIVNISPINGGTETVVITLSNTATQHLVLGGTDAEKVTISGNDGNDNRTLSVDTSSIKITGGTVSFTIAVSENGRTGINYTVNVNVVDELHAKLMEEAAKFLDIAWSDTSEVGDTLSMNLNAPLSSGYSYAVSLAANSYTLVAQGGQELELGKLNTTDSALIYNAVVHITDTANQLSREKEIVVTLPISKHWVDLNSEADKFSDVSYTNQQEVGEVLGMSLSSALSSGYTYELVVEENDYFESTADEQSFKLKKLNMMSGTVTGNFSFLVNDTARNLSVTRDIVVTLPTSKYLALFEAEAAKFSNISFNESAKENDDLEMSISEPLSSGYTYEIIVQSNEYIEADASDKKVVLKKKNESGNSVRENIAVKITDTVRNESIEKTIRVTIPNYVYYGAKIGTVQLVGYHEEDVSYNADLTRFWVTYELDNYIDTSALSVADFIIQGMDRNATVFISNFRKDGSTLVSMDVEIIAPDGDKKNYTISVHFLNN